MNRRVGRTAAALGAVVLSGCAYHVPQPSANIGMRAITSDVAYGSAVSAALPGVVPIRMSGPPPSPFQPGSAVRSGSVPQGTYPSPRAAFSCPPARSTTVVEPTISRVTGPPVPAMYSYRALEQTKTGSTAGAVVHLSETRQISRVVSQGNVISYTVTTAYAGTGIVENTDYQVVTSSPVPQDQESDVPVGTDSGVYVTSQSVTTTSADGSPTTSTLTWKPALQVLKLPATPGSIWAVSSVDQKTGDSESFTATVNGISQVNACGSLVQGYEVELSGKLVTPRASYPLTFDENEIIAPQYGGLVLADSASVTTQSSPTATQTQLVQDAINVTPKLAREGS